MNQRIKGMIKKEFMHILRDYQTLIITLLMPVTMLLLYGYALTLDLKDIKTGIIDYDRTPQSRDLSTKFKASDFFVTHDLTNERISDIPHFMRGKKYRLVIVFPRGFGRKLVLGKNPEVKAYIDGADPNSAKLVYYYTSAFAKLFSVQLGSSPIQIVQRFIFNQNLSPPFFFVPGLVAFIMIMLSSLLTAITISREIETGTMEQLLVSPLKPYEIILGKTVPYLAVAMTAEFFIIVLGLLLFSIPFKGSLTFLFVVSILFITASLAIGLLSSTTSKTQQVAMFKALMITLLPTLILSGFIFPLESMHFIFRWLSNVIPAKFFVTIARGILLKGNNFAILWPSVAGLVIVSFILMIVSIKKFKVYLG
jgi:ABC-2 type transport system permease protein